MVLVVSTTHRRQIIGWAPKPHVSPVLRTTGFFRDGSLTIGINMAS